MVSNWSFEVTEDYYRHLIRVGKILCKKCEKKFVIGDTLVRKKKHGGKTDPYHKKCYERLFQ